MPGVIGVWIPFYMWRESSEQARHMAFSDDKLNGITVESGKFKYQQQIEFWFTTVIRNIVTFCILQLN